MNKWDEVMQQIAELEERVSKLEGKVFYVAPLPEPKAEPMPTRILICIGLPVRSDPFELPKRESLVVVDGRVVSGKAITPDLHKAADLTVIGGTEEPVTDAPLEVLHALIDAGADVRERTEHKGQRTSVAIRSHEDLEEALKRIAAGQPALQAS